MRCTVSDDAEVRDLSVDVGNKSKIKVRGLIMRQGF